MQIRRLAICYPVRDGGSIWKGASLVDRLGGRKPDDQQEIGNRILKDSAAAWWEHAINCEMVRQ